MNIRNNVIKTYVEDYYRTCSEYVPAKYNWLGCMTSIAKYVDKKVYVPARYETTSTLEILNSDGQWIKIPEIVSNVRVSEPCKGC